MRLRQRLRLRTIGVLTSLTLVLGVGLPVAFGALDAQAVNCSFGDNFYYFVNVSTGHAFGYHSNDYVYDDGGTLQNQDFCQLSEGYGGTWYAWVAKGTSLCLQTDSIGEVMVATCDGDSDQEWTLYDDDGNSGQFGETWGGVIGYSSDAMVDVTSGEPITTGAWLDNGEFAFDLNGPFQ